MIKITTRLSFRHAEIELTKAIDKNEPDKFELYLLNRTLSEHVIVSLSADELVQLRMLLCNVGL